MIQKLNLRELKGAPLSIILAIMMAGNRTVTVSQLCTETGYSDKTVANGLDLLRGRQIVTETRRNHYQLTGGNVQLPLYWDERTEPADPSPASFQEELPGLRSQSGKFSDGNFQSGKIPETEIKRSSNDLIGEIPEISARISALEAEMQQLKELLLSDSRTILAGISPKYGESSADNGEIPNVNFLKTTINNTDTELTDVNLFVDSGESPNPGKIPELTEEELDRRYETNKDICYEYLRSQRSFAAGCEYTADQLNEVLDQDPDPELLEFLLPRAKNFESLKKWSGLDLPSAKEKLGRLFGFWGNGLREIADRADIHLGNMDYHFWNWILNENDKKNIKIGAVLTRILNHEDELRAKSSEPLKVMYLGIDEI